MLFASVCTVVLAAASFAVATPVQYEGGILTSLNTRQQLQAPSCIQGLIKPYSKADLESLQSWFLNTTPDVDDNIGPNGWFTWTLGSTRICIYNTNPNGTKEEVVNHKTHAQGLEQVRDTCCSPTTDQCRAGRATEYSASGAELALRVTANSTLC